MPAPHIPDATKIRSSRWLEAQRALFASPVHPAKSVLSALLLVVLQGCTSGQRLADFDAPVNSPNASNHSTLSNGEWAATCPRLTEIIKGEIARMKELRAKIKNEIEAPPPTLLSAWQRAFGEPGQGTDAQAEYDKKLRRVAEINADLKGKGCETVNIETRI
jgi:hypothetical protein